MYCHSHTERPEHATQNESDMTICAALTKRAFGLVAVGEQLAFGHNGTSLKHWPNAKAIHLSPIVRCLSVNPSIELMHDFV